MILLLCKLCLPSLPWTFQPQDVTQALGSQQPWNVQLSFRSSWGDQPWGSDDAQWKSLSPEQAVCGVGAEGSLRLIAAVFGDCHDLSLV